MRKKNGFTLIELLAVIVILAIIALIAVPQVMKILNQARISAAEDSTYGIYNAAQDYISKVMIDNGGDFPEVDLTFTCDPTSCKLDNYATLSSEYNLEETLEYKGKKATSGKIKIINEGKDIIFENLVVSGFNCNYSNEKATCEKGGNSSNGGSSSNGGGNTSVQTVSFADDDWSTIKAAVQNGSLSNYHVGDTKTIEMDIDSDGTPEIYTLRIANTSTPSECSAEGFSQTACGFVVEFVDAISMHRMNPYDSNDTTSNGNGNKGGWEYSEMRSYVNNDIYNSLPSDLKSVIKQITVVSSHGKTDSNNFITTDKIYLLSTKEVGFEAPYDTAKAETRILDYYNTNNNNESRIKKYNDSSVWWLLRSANSTRDYNFFVSYETGSYYYSTSNYNQGVSPAFRIG